MGDEQFHVDISEKLGRIAGNIEALHNDVKRINGSVASVTRMTNDNRNDIANMKGEARGRSIGWGAGAGAVIAGVIEILRSWK